MALRTRRKIWISRHRLNWLLKQEQLLSDIMMGYRVCMNCPDYGDRPLPKNAKRFECNHPREMRDDS